MTSWEWSIWKRLPKESWRIKGTHKDMSQFIVILLKQRNWHRCRTLAMLSWLWGYVKLRIHFDDLEGRSNSVQWQREVYRDGVGWTIWKSTIVRMDWENNPVQWQSILCLFKCVCGILHQEWVEICTLWLKVPNCIRNKSNLEYLIWLY